MRTHGMFGTPIYSSWSAMLYRCRNPNAPAYKDYGGRGVKVCDRWVRFELFYEDMGSGHWDGAEIDRIDPNGDYTPGNCRWVTATENARNRRNAIFVEYRGERISLADLCSGKGVSRPHVLSRLRLGWSLEKALSAPVKRRGTTQVAYEGRTYTVRQLARVAGLTENTLRGRLRRGHSLEEALNWKGKTK